MKLKFWDGWSTENLGKWVRLLTRRRKYEISCQRNIWAYFSG